VEQPPEGPISAAVDVLADRWSLLILRDVIFADRRYFRGLLTGSAEGIASNMLADRLKRLLDAGILTRGAAGRGQRARFSLTEAGIQTLPVLIALGDWGLEWRPSAPGSQSRQRVIRAGGDAFVAELMAELRVRHLDAPAEFHDGPGPFARLDAPDEEPDDLWGGPSTD
jgi:DNA-binding HxlR family transcriptional regulator